MRRRRGEKATGGHLGLARLEVVAADEDVLALGVVDEAGDEGVLRGAVDEGAALVDGSDGVHGGGGDLRLGAVDRAEKVVGRVVDALHDLGIPLRVGRPEDDDLVQAVLGLELADVLLDLGNLLRRGALEDVVGAAGLVARDEVLVEDGGERLHVAEEGGDLALELPVEDSGTLGGVGHV